MKSCNVMFWKGWIDSYFSPGKDKDTLCFLKRVHTLSFLLALNFFRHSTVSCLCIMEATVERCCGNTREEEMLKIKQKKLWQWQVYVGGSSRRDVLILRWRNIQLCFTVSWQPLLFYTVIVFYNTECGATYGAYCSVQWWRKCSHALLKLQKSARHFKQLWLLDNCHITVSSFSLFFSHW